MGVCKRGVGHPRSFHFLRVAPLRFCSSRLGLWATLAASLFPNTAMSGFRSCSGAQPFPIHALCGRLFNPFLVLHGQCILQTVTAGPGGCIMPSTSAAVHCACASHSPALAIRKWERQRLEQPQAWLDVGVDTGDRGAATAWRSPVGLSRFQTIQSRNNPACRKLGRGPTNGAVVSGKSPDGTGIAVSNASSPVVITL